MPDLICSVMLTPGMMVADLFHGLGVAEYLLLSRSVTFIIFAAVAYGILSIKKPII